MTDIVVHRCELRIRRTSGWAWGATPDDLIKAATRALPQLLAAKLPQLAVADGETVTIDRPITVKLAATVRQLVALGDGSTGSPETAELRARIEVEVAQAVAQAIAREGVATATSPAIAQVTSATAEAAATETELASDEAPRRALRAWLRAGTLDPVLARLEPGAAARLHEFLFESELDIAARPALVELVRRHANTISVALRADRVRARIAIAAGVLEEVPATRAAELRSAIDQIVPLALETTETHGEVPVEHVSSSSRPIEHVGEIEIRSALPFLLLASLQHAGWLDAATTLIAAHRREADAFALAAGIAGAVLGPVDRGWLRTRADRLAIAVFAGRVDPIADAELSSAAIRLRPLLVPLDAGLRAVIARARRPVPLVLWRESRGWLLVDTDGVVVLGASTELRDVLAVAPRSPVIVPARFVGDGVLDQIDYANAQFITDAAPGRGQSWRTFAGTDRRLYTNDTATPAGKLAAITAHLEHALALVEELAETLAERPAIPRDPLTAFEATCMLAATSALADLGERLFPTEPATPILALTRFQSLDARVTFEHDMIRVRVPLGRRHADLMRTGILGELGNVPWLSGRTLALGGG